MTSPEIPFPVGAALAATISYGFIRLFLFRDSKNFPTLAFMPFGRSTPGTKALRNGRTSEPRRAYVVTFATQRRIRWFENFYVARIMCRVLNQVPTRKTLCYVVMPDHVHWLIELAEVVSLSKTVRLAKGRSAYFINRQLERSGRIWQAGYHDRAVRKEEELVMIARYIIENPVRAKLCKGVAEYPHWDAEWL